MSQEVWHGRIRHPGVRRGAGVVVHVDGLAFFEPRGTLGWDHSCTELSQPLTRSLTPLTYPHSLLGPKTFWQEPRELFPLPQHVLPVAVLDVGINSNSHTQDVELHVAYYFS